MAVYLRARLDHVRLADERGGPVGEYAVLLAIIVAGIALAGAVIALINAKIGELGAGGGGATGNF